MADHSCPFGRSLFGDLWSHRTISARDFYDPEFNEAEIYETQFSVYAEGAERNLMYPYLAAFDGYFCDPSKLRLLVFQEQEVTQTRLEMFRACAYRGASFVPDSFHFERLSMEDVFDVTAVHPDGRVENFQTSRAWVERALFPSEQSREACANTVVAVAAIYDGVEYRAFMVYPAE